MMGTSHATSGALGWLLIGPAIAGVLASPLEGKEIVAGALVTAGAALLPDLDHPNATIAYALGPVTQVLARGVNLVAGGHRQATHSLLFALFAGVATTALVKWSATAALLIAWFMIALALRALHIVPPRTGHNIKGLVIAIEATIIVWAMAKFLPGDWWWLGVAVGLGSLLHLFGDCLTPEGVPFFWPLKWRGSIPIIPKTGGMMETYIVTPLMTIATFYLLYRLWMPDGFDSSMLPWN